MPRLKIFNRRPRSCFNHSVPSNFGSLLKKSKALPKKIVTNDPSLFDNDPEGNLFHHVC